MAKAKTGSNDDEPRRLPRGRHALAPEQVQADQRQRLVDAVPRVVAERGYEAMSVADVGKAYGACACGSAVAGDLGAHVAGVSAVVGHCYPVWNDFDGGKGLEAALASL